MKTERKCAPARPRSPALCGHPAEKPWGVSTKVLKDGQISNIDHPKNPWCIYHNVIISHNVIMS